MQKWPLGSLIKIYCTQELWSPWLVGLHDMTTGSLVCGGTLVASRYVVTAASCVQARTAWDLYAVLGPGHSGLETQRGIARVHVHEGYSPEQPTLSGVAVLELDREVELASHTPACVDTNPGPDLELRGAVYQLQGWAGAGAGGGIAEHDVAGVNSSCEGDGVMCAGEQRLEVCQVIVNLNIFSKNNV